MTPELFSTVVGIVLSVLYAVVQMAWPKTGEITSNQKRALTIGAAVLSGAGVFGLACLGKTPWLPGYTCSLDGVEAVTLLVVANLGGSQAAFYAGKLISWAKPIVAGWFKKADAAPQ